MVSESQSMMVARAPKTAYPLLETYRTVRLKFLKTGSMQYISHLDLQRTFARVLTRADIPVWYTKGFNPHAKIVFALPLSIGAQSVCELVDVRIERDMPVEEIRDRLNAEMTEEMQILDAYIPESTSDFSQIAWAAYDLNFCIGHGEYPDHLPDQIQAYLTTSPIMIEKRSKSGIREMDMVPMIRSVRAAYRGEGEKRELVVQAVLGAHDADYLNPEYVVRAIRERFSLLFPDDPSGDYEIFRRMVLLPDGETEFR